MLVWGRSEEGISVEDTNPILSGDSDASCEETVVKMVKKRQEREPLTRHA